MVVNDANLERIILRRNVRKINILCANVVCGRRLQPQSTNRSTVDF